MMTWGVALVISKPKELKPPPITYQIAFVPPAAPVEKAKPKEEPKPKVEEPKPKPKEEPKPKVEEPKPKPKEEPKPKPKVEEPKPKPKEEPKPKPKEEPKPKPVPLKEIDPVEEEAPPTRFDPIEPQEELTPRGTVQQLPSILDAWGRLVQRKVEKYWAVPSGIRITDAENEAVVSFWVDRSGHLIGEPTVVKNAVDESLAESGVRAIQLAEPLPPLPDDFPEPEQQVVYVFSLSR